MCVTIKQIQDMKKIIKWTVCLLLSLPFLTACDWEELPAWEEADISGVQFYYRWESEEYDPMLPDEPIIYKQRLNTEQVRRDADNGILEVRVSLPVTNEEFTSDVRDKVTTNPLWGQVTVSTAARVTPIDGSKPLGTPDDWSVPRRFSVQAANGTTKEWTITIVEFNK